MADVPNILDEDLQRRRLERAVKGGPATFLLEHVTSDLGERLSPVLRRFESVLDFFSPLGAGGDALVRRSPDAQTTRLAASVSLACGDGWTIADPAIWDPGSGQYDAIVSLLMLQTLNDIPGALVRLRRALRPDGLFIAALIGGDSLKELRQAFLTAEVEIAGGASPRVAPFADVRAMGHLLQRAGFALPVTDSETLTVRYASALDLMRDLRAMGATNALSERVRRPLRRAILARAIEAYAERFSDQDGRIRATFEIIWLSGWAPHESQQKPLQPGTGKMRLADALSAVSTARAAIEPAKDKR
ncbi:MAG TPA: methyltransferase domain-containing protein [Beijerinckiaceae bacterium]|nr:methyltransferase domain-containing protein [Beijerinckiaceae bacterium]